MHNDSVVQSLFGRINHARFWLSKRSLGTCTWKVITYSWISKLRIKCAVMIVFDGKLNIETEWRSSWSCNVSKSGSRCATSEESSFWWLALCYALLIFAIVSFFIFLFNDYVCLFFDLYGRCFFFSVWLIWREKFVRKCFVYNLIFYKI